MPVSLRGQSFWINWVVQLLMHPTWIQNTHSHSSCCCLRFCSVALENAIKCYGLKSRNFARSSHVLLPAASPSIIYHICIYIYTVESNETNCCHIHTHTNPYISLLTEKHLIRNNFPNLRSIAKCEKSNLLPWILMRDGKTPVFPHIYKQQANKFTHTNIHKIFKIQLPNGHFSNNLSL